MTEIVFKEESYNIIGVCIRVYHELGSGFLEAVYEQAMAKEFQASGIPFDRQVKLNIRYKGEALAKYYVADFICYDQIVLEVKTVSFLMKQHLSQTLNYLKATDKRLGLLVNYGGNRFEYRRVLNSGVR